MRVKEAKSNKLSSQEAEELVSKIEDLLSRGYKIVADDAFNERCIRIYSVGVTVPPRMSHNTWTAHGIDADGLLVNLDNLIITAQAPPPSSYEIYRPKNYDSQ
jgi:hypothetical protein